MAAHIRSSTRPSALRYLPALDGLRALSVAAVFAYHAGLPWARGGFLGVDVFFVLSGYLITSLLLTEVHHRDRLDLIAFWKRRARRLLPALFAFLAVAALTVPALAADQASRLRGDVLGALGYVTNWRLIFEQQSYFQAAGRPPLLQHLWSLAIEEQFYLLWPVVLIGLLAWRGTRERLVAPILGMAVGSAVLMAWLFDPTLDPSRVYYGTDTRIGTLLVGAALACVWAPDRLQPNVTAPARRLIGVVGAVGLAGVAGFVWRADQFQTGLYRGGFLAVSILAAMTVAAIAHPATTRISRLLGARPLAALGKRSYALYLWHWPVINLTRPHADVDLTGTPLIILQAAITLALAEASYRLVERPIRRGVLSRAWAPVGVAGRPAGSASRTAVVAFVSVAVVTIAILSSLVVGHRPALPPEFAGVDTQLTDAAVAAARTPPSSTAPAVQPPHLQPTSASPQTSTPGPSATTVPERRETPTTAPAAPPAVAAPEVPKPTPPPPGAGAVVTALGDSVMVIAAPALRARVPGINVDAVVGRQPKDAIRVAKDLRAAGRLGEVVVLHLGTNGPFRPSELDALFEVLSEVRRVVVVNVKVPRPWEQTSNDALGDAVHLHPNTVLVDWHRFGNDHPELFYDDGVHLRPAGIDQYVQLVTAAI